MLGAGIALVIAFCGLLAILFKLFDRKSSQFRVRSLEHVVNAALVRVAVEVVELGLADVNGNHGQSCCQRLKETAGSLCWWADLAARRPIEARTVVLDDGAFRGNV